MYKKTDTCTTSTHPSIHPASQPSIHPSYTITRACVQTYIHAYMHTLLHRCINTYIHRYRDRQTDGRTDRQTDMHTYIYAYHPCDFTYTPYRETREAFNENSEPQSREVVFGSTAAMLVPSVSALAAGLGHSLLRNSFSSYTAQESIANSVE